MWRCNACQLVIRTAETHVNATSLQPHSHLLVKTTRFHSLKCWVLHDSCSTMKTAALLCYLSLDAVIPTLKHKKLWKVRRSWYKKKKSDLAPSVLSPFHTWSQHFSNMISYVYVVLFAHGLSLEGYLFSSVVLFVVNKNVTGEGQQPSLPVSLPPSFGDSCSCSYVGDRCGLKVWTCVHITGGKTSIFFCTRFWGKWKLTHWQTAISKIPSTSF